MRVHRNCSNQKDYEIQLYVLMHRFVEKGYKKGKLEAFRNEIKMMDGETMLNTKRKKKKSKNMKMAFLTGLIDNIKHWKKT